MAMGTRWRTKRLTMKFCICTNKMIEYLDKRFVLLHRITVSLFKIDIQIRYGLQSLFSTSTFSEFPDNGLSRNSPLSRGGWSTLKNPGWEEIIYYLQLERVVILL